jgi:hypothetical protein
MTQMTQMDEAKVLAYESTAICAICGSELVGVFCEQ